MSRNRLRVLLPIGVLLLAGVGTFALIATRPNVETQEHVAVAPRVRVATVEPEAVQLKVETHGTVAPRTESDLVAQVSGQVTEVSPALVSGGFFTEGEVLLEIDPRDYRTARERARAALLRADSEHQRAVRELERLTKLFDQNVASASRLDDATNAERVAEAVRAEARAALDQAERDLDRTKLRAPYTGRVRDESVGVGQFVSAGSPVARLYATDYVEVRLPIPDAQLAFLDLPVLRGGPATNGKTRPVLLSAKFAGDTHSWQGRIVRTEGEIDAKSRMVHAVARVESPYEVVEGDDRPPLAVGLFVRAEIPGVELASASVLPPSALHGEDQVWIVDDEDRLRERRVEVLRSDRSAVIIASGLSEGERVVTSPLAAAIEGMKVRPEASPARIDP